MSITNAFIATLGLLVGVLVTSLLFEWRAMRKRIAELEKASDKRHLPYAAAEEIENAALAIDLLMDDLEFKRSLLQNALGHIQNARENKRAR